MDTMLVHIHDGGFDNELPALVVRADNCYVNIVNIREQ